MVTECKCQLPPLLLKMLLINLHMLVWLGITSKLCVCIVYVHDTAGCVQQYIVNINYYTCI